MAAVCSIKSSCKWRLEWQSTTSTVMKMKKNPGNPKNASKLLTASVCLVSLTFRQWRHQRFIISLRNDVDAGYLPSTTENDGGGNQSASTRINWTAPPTSFFKNLIAQQRAGERLVHRCAVLAFHLQVAALSLEIWARAHLSPVTCHGPAASLPSAQQSKDRKYNLW